VTGNVLASRTRNASWMAKGAPHHFSRTLPLAGNRTSGRAGGQAPDTMEPEQPDGRVAGFRPGHRRVHDRLLEFCTCGAVSPGPVSSGPVAGRAVLLPGQRIVRDGGTGRCPRPAEAGYCRRGGAKVWANLASCGWPASANTGPDLSQCPGHRLAANAGSLTRTIRVTAANTVISCESIQGMLDIEAQNVTVKDSVIESNSGKLGEAANGSADIKVEDGASAIIDHVKINGDQGVHACIWHQGTRLVVNAVNCYGSNDGIFSWADHG